jgi:hypothetical protein
VSDAPPPNSQPTQPLRLFGIREAAKYCGLAVRTLKYHIYESGELKADANVGHSLVFTQTTLDDFLRRRRPAHRPPGSGRKTPPPAEPSQP